MFGELFGDDILSSLKRNTILVGKTPHVDYKDSPKGINWKKLSRNGHLDKIASGTARKKRRWKAPGARDTCFLVQVCSSRVVSQALPCRPRTLAYVEVLHHLFIQIASGVFHPAQSPSSPVGVTSPNTTNYHRSCAIRIVASLAERSEASWTLAHIVHIVHDGVDPHSELQRQKTVYIMATVL